MVKRTLFGASSTLLTRLTPGFMMIILPYHAAIRAPSIGSAPSLFSPSLHVQSPLSTFSTTSLITPVPSALTFFFPGAMTSAPFANNPTCISAWMPPLRPLASLNKRQHSACHPNYVLLLDTLLYISLLKNNHSYMLSHPFDLNPIAS